MTMKRRIFLSNTVMVLLVLLILFGIGGVSVLLFKEELMNIIEQNAELPDPVYEVQTMLYEQQKNLDTWEEISDRLSEYHFELYVSDEGQGEVYSNAKHSQMECIEELEEGTFSDNGVKLYNMEGVTIARCIVKSGGESYMLYAAYCPEDMSLWGMDRGVFEMFLIVFMIAGILVIAGLLVCSQIFTKLMIRRIMEPVEALNQAALRVNDGNLEEPIQYNVNDEFGEVCYTFNEMQRHLKEELEKSRKYEQARTEMISGISHDLRTPLTSVKGFIKGMLDGVANTPKKQEQYLKISYQKACDMERLLQKLFFFSKLETGNMPLLLQKIELGGWLEAYAKEKQLEGKEEKYSFLYTQPQENCYVNIDAEQMKRVLDNLLENSMKYAETEHLCVTLTIQKQEHMIHICFSDNGKGIAEDKLPHVFEQFYRGDEARNSKNDGSGLGLYVCKYLVEQQAGEIRAYNRNGFTVEILLPEIEE